MNILLVQRAVYAPAYGGANKTNKILCELLSGLGHNCSVLAMAFESGAKNDFMNCRSILENMGAEIETATEDEIDFRLNEVFVQALTRPSGLRTALSTKLMNPAIDVILVSSEDPFQELLGIAVEACPRKTVYMAHTTVLLPFGPASMLPFPPGAERLRRAAGIITTSEFMRSYIRRWGNIASTYFRLPIYGPGPHPNLGRFDGEHVLMVNPCAVKGISIFLELADALPNVAFAAKVSWGTTREDLAALRKRPNIEITEPVQDVNRMFERASAVLAPSLWDEAFGAICVDAMLRGVPVIASNSGGLPEAKLGVEYTVPVHTISNYTQDFDDRLIPRPVLPKQDIRPWIEALTDLFAYSSRYDDISRRSRAAAHAYVDCCNVQPVEAYLATLVDSSQLPAASS